jgi:peptidoglycan/LPS O-acetylase OafA/YrhL
MTSRNAALDGVRGFAALSVVSCHLSVSMGLLPYETGGFIGVLVFFVLSGYLIAAMCWRAPSSWAAYRLFLSRRVQRLGPVIGALVVVGTPSLVLLGGQSLPDMLFDAVLAASQTTGLAWTFFHESHPAWSPTWSLTVEWIFYLCFPVAVLACKRIAVSAETARNLATGSAALLYALGLFLEPKAFYLLPVANLAVMLAGAALALHHAGAKGAMTPTDPAPPLIALVLLVLLVALPGRTLGTGYKLVILPAITIATLVIVNGCRSNSVLTSVLASRLLRAVGVRAYSLYIWHMPVFWISWFSLRESTRAVQAASALILLVPVVLLSFRYLEKPWLAAPRTALATALPGPVSRTAETDPLSTGVSAGERKLGGGA